MFFRPFAYLNVSRLVDNFLFCGSFLRYNVDMKKICFSFVFVVFLLLLYPSAFIFGQSGIESLLGKSLQSSNSTISLSLSPTNPGPNADVTAKVSSFQANVDTTNIIWYINGQKKLSGVGKKNFTFRTGDVGDTITLSVVLETEAYGTIKKELVILPNSLEVLWEADTYVPPFYKGKALPSSQSSVRVIAMPRFVDQNALIDANSVVYVWKKGYFKDPDGSGFGRNAFVYKTGYTFNDDEITVSASTQNGSISITKKIPIHVYEPKILFFENKPLESIRYENALVNVFTYAESELTLHAAPFFFSLSDLNNNTASFVWKIDGKTLETDPENKAEFTLRKPEKGSGKYQLKLDVTNFGYDLQTASKNITLVYDNQNQ